MDNIDKTFKPTPQWMAEKYDEMNKQLFGGRLGKCDFEVFTTGKGSEGGTLGWFKITGKNIKIRRYDRQLHQLPHDERQPNGIIMHYGDRNVNYDNFYQICKPRIELNGNYSGTEHGFLATLVHEMCHYYTYMNGYAPKQGHGPEFREIGMIVSSRSKGLFTIQRLASAEDMSELELNDEMKAKRAKREANKLSNTIAIVVYKQSGDVRLILTRSERLVYQIYGIESKRKDTVKVFRSNDSQLIEKFFSKGYKSLMRTYRFWNIGQNKELLAAIDEADGKELYENPELSGTMLTTKRPTQTLSINPQPPKPKEPKIIFSIKTSTGVFETSCNSFIELRQKLQQRFPNMSYETISKLMGNRSNFKKLEENHMNSKQIVKEVIEEFMQNEFRGANNLGDDIDITPDMNLGKYSPLEIE
jgi:hypothetical protein